MSSVPPAHEFDLPAELAQRVDRMCDAFEAAWKNARTSAERPRIEDFLRDGAESERLALLRELIVSDAYGRRRAGERPRAEDYQSRFPQLDAAWLAEIVVLPAEGPASANAGINAGDRSVAGNADAVPKQLGEYRILRQVGRGGMGAVYEAVQESLGRHVALKVLPFNRLLGETHLERFRREARAAARLHHTNIVPVFGVGEHEGIHYYAMQFIQGQGLDEVLREVKRLRNPLQTSVASDQSLAAQVAEGLRSGHFAQNPEEIQAASTKAAAVIAAPADESLAAKRPERVDPHGSLSTFGSRSKLRTQSEMEYFRSIARVGAQVADALEYAHRQGIVHRDIKPSNLLLDTEGIIWVTDFGLAKQEDAGELTKPGDVVGTYRYMAPERFDGRSDPRGDIYSLGMTLYELLTLQPAFDDSQAARLIERIKHEQPLLPSKIDRRIPRDLETIVLKAGAKAPGERYATAEELAEDLRRFLADRPIQARRTPVIERTWRWCRRNPARAALIAVSGTAVLTLLAVISVFTIQLGTALTITEQARAAAQAKEREALAAKASAEEEAQKAREAEADTRAFSRFLVNDVLAVARPEGVQGGLGINVTVAQALEAAEPKLDKVFAGRRLAEAQARHSIGVTWRELGRYPEAERNLRRAIELFRQKLGPDDAHTLNSANSLGRTVDQAGRSREAVVLLEQVRDAQVKKLGAGHSDTLTTLNNLARAYRGCGQTTEAIALYEQVRDAKVKMLGADHPDTLVVLNNLALAYRTAGRTAEAIALYERARDACMRKLGADHRETLTTLNNLADAYQAAGKTAEAIALLEQVRDAWVKKLGGDHPDTLVTLNNLALAYRAAGKTAEAIALYEQVLDAKVKKLGADHPDTLTTLNNLAFAYQVAGKKAEAIALYEQVLDVRLKELGPNHPDTLITLNNLGGAYQATGKLEQALPLFQQAATGIEKRKFAHQFAGQIVGNLTDCHERLKQFEPAEVWRRKWLAVVKERTGPESAAYAAELAALGHNLLMQKKHAEAEQTLRDCLTLRVKQQPDAWTTFHTESMLGHALLGQQKYAEAEPLLKEGYESMKQRAPQMPAKDKIRLNEGVERLVELYDAWGNKGDAAKWRQELEETKRAARR